MNELSSKKDELERANVALQGRNETLERAGEWMRQQIIDVQNTEEKNQWEIVGLRRSGDEKKVTIEKMENKEGLFLEMILDKAATPKHTDDQVIAEFVALHHRIQRLVSKIKVELTDKRLHHYPGYQALQPPTSKSGFKASFFKTFIHSCCLKGLMASNLRRLCWWTNSALRSSSRG